MRNNNRLVSFLAIAITLIPFFGLAQQPVQQRDPEKTWNKAIDLWEKQKYSDAQKYFIESSNNFSSISDPRLIDSKYYEAYCALKLYNRDAEFRFKEFLNDYPEDPRVDNSYFMLGKYNFERKKYRQTLDYFNHIELNRLEKKHHSDYYYFAGYSHFMEDNIDDAKSLFQHNNHPADTYYHPALYYLAYIDYLNENYQIALNGFEKLKTVDGFSELVPYYIAQIYFLQGRYKELIEQAEPWFESTSSKNKYEMARLIGESYFHEKRYEEALPYFNIYFTNSSGFSRDDYYAFGYTLYKTTNYKKAIIQFNRVVNTDDALSQVALLNLGDCFLKTDQLKSAQVAFSRAAKLDFDQQITEDAYFNYAKISYQLSFDPYDEAIKAFEAYLDTYPNSERKNEAYLFLLNVYMKTKNYQAAIDVIGKIRNPDNQVKKAFQLSVYNLAVDHFLQENYDESLRLFQLVGKYDFEKILLAESNYWQGELKYRKKNYRGALESFQLFLKASQAQQSKYFASGYYGRGYAQLKLKAYEKSRKSFQMFIDLYDGNDQKKISDTELRIGDLKFIQKEYASAIANFQKAISHSSYDKDYALFQIAMSQGYMENSQEKIRVLNRLVTEIPESVYIPRALFEMGSTYFEIGEYDLAIKYFINVEEHSPNSRLVAQSRLKRGLIYIRTKQDSKAKEVFLSVIDEYPNTKESSEALISLKEVDMEAFTTIARSSGFANISEEDVDAANFEEAEEVYLAGNYERSSRLLGHYLNGFPNGRFRQNARYYKADCHVRMEQPDSAIVQYEALLNYPGGPYYENSLYMAAYLTGSMGEEIKAYKLYKKLFKESENKQYKYDALSYLMITGFKLADYENAVNWAHAIRLDDKPDESLKQKALLIEIKSLVQLDQKQAAFNLLPDANQDLRDETSAEISYLKAKWIYEQGNYEQAEDAVYFLIQNFASFPEWRAKGFILLGDVYAGMDDDFQAKATWQSVIDNHKGADLVAIAQQKLDNLLAIEEQENKSEKPEIEMEYNPEEKKVESISVDTTRIDMSDTTGIIQHEIKPVRDTISDNPENDKHE